MSAIVSKAPSPSSPTLQLEDLRRYQELSIDWLTERPGAALWVDMGLGKTVSTLTAFQRLQWRYDADKMLVVAPLRVARKTWHDEVQTWAHLNGMRVSAIVGNVKQRLAAMHAEADVYTVNRENLVWLLDQHLDGKRILMPWKWDVFALDEASSFRNRGSKRWVAANKIRKHFVNYVWELTGTPSPKGLENLWAQAYLMDGGQRLGNTLTAFRQRWFDKPDFGQFDYRAKPHAKAEILDLMKDVALTLREDDWLDLPPVVYNEVPVYLTKPQLNVYRRFEKDYVMQLNSKTISAVNAGVLAGKLMQLSNGAVYTQAPAYETFHNEKTKALLELRDDLDGPIIAVYNYRSDLERMLAGLHKARINHRLLESKSDEDDWNAGKIDVLVLHPASAGHGLNLHHSGSEHLVWYGLNPDLELYQQANARLIGGHRRAGRSVVIHHIVAQGTRDHRVLSVLQDRDADQSSLMNALRRV